MTSAALSSAPALSQPPTAAGIAGSARPAPSAHGSRSTRTAPGFLRSVGVELLKMRRLRVLLITVLLVIASVAMSSIDLFSQSKIHSLADPATKPWASLLLAMVLFNALTQPGQSSPQSSPAGRPISSTAGPDGTWHRRRA